MHSENTEIPDVTVVLAHFSEQAIVLHGGQMGESQNDTEPKPHLSHDRGANSGQGRLVLPWRHGICAILADVISTFPGCMPISRITTV